MRRRSVLRLALLPLVLGCGAGEPVRVGGVLPLAGAAGIYGRSVERGMTIAAEELRSEARRGRVPFEVVLDVRDSASQPQRAAAALEELFEEGAVAAVGGVTSAEALAMIDVADDARRVVISPAARSPELEGASRYLFRLFPSVDREGSKLASFAALELGIDRSVLVAPRGDRSAADSFAQEFERNRGTIVGRVSYGVFDAGKADVTREILSYRSQAVLVEGLGEPVAQIVSGLEQGGYRGAVLTTSAFAAPEVIAAAGRHAEGVLLSRPGFDPASDEPAVRRFVETYRERHGEEPGIYAAYGYDAVRVLAAALEQEGRVPRNLWQGLHALRDYEGVTGPIQFDQMNGVTAFPRVYVVSSKGELEAISKMEERRRRRLLDRIARIASGRVADLSLPAAL